MDEISGPEVEAAPSNGSGGASIHRIEDGKSRKRKPSAEAPKAPSKAEVYKEFRRLLEGRKEDEGWPALGRSFKILRDKAGVESMLEFSDDGVAKHVSPQAVISALVDYSIKKLPASGIYMPALTSKDTKEIVFQWAACQEHFEEDDIELVLDKSEPGICWQRLPFDRAPGPTPVFDELFKRMGNNAHAVRAWIGSLAAKTSDRQQYVWLYGGGQNSKGSLINFLARVYGPSYKSVTSLSRKRQPNQFWSRYLLGKRLVAFPDFGYPEFVQDDLFKSLTGGDLIETEIKGGAVTESKMICKFLFASQEHPSVTSSVADQRRAIYCHMDPLPEGTKLLPAAEYAELLWNEAPAFLHKCDVAFKDYAKLSAIPVHKEELTALSRQAEEKWHVVLYNLFDREIVPTADGKDDPRPLTILASDFRDSLRLIEKLNDQEIGKFKAFLEREVKADRKQVPLDGKRLWSYSGIRLNELTERRLRAERTRGM